MHKIIISVDWFQYFCYRPTDEDLDRLYVGVARDRNGKHTDYIVDEPIEFSPIYRKHACVYAHKRPFFHVAWQPASSALKPNMCSIKVDNSLLYEPDWSFYLHDFLASVGWQIGGITRIDLCADFNELADGMKPQEFVNRYMSQETKDRPTYFRYQSDKYHVEGHKQVGNNGVKGIRWGKRVSEVCTYIYDKSRELREVKHKPWIQRQWLEAGFDVKNVWRVEFSINSKGTHLYNWDTHVYQRLSGKDVETQQSIENLFWAYANDYFRFYEYRQGEFRKKREWPEYYPLQRNDEVTVKHVSKYRQVQSGRSERMLANKLEDLYHSDTDFTPQEYEAMKATISILERKWMMNKRRWGAANKLASSIIDSIPFFSELRLKERELNTTPFYLQQQREKRYQYLRLADKWANEGGASRLRTMLTYRQHIANIRALIAQYINNSV